jgi:hypothetical protein
LGTNTIIFIVLLVVLALLAMFVIPQWRLRRAIRQVIRILREHNAIGIKSAKTVDELGLKPRSMLEGMFRGRDYKQYALSTLMKAEIIKTTGEGKLYLMEDKLAASNLGKSASYSR